MSFSAPANAGKFAEKTRTLSSKAGRNQLPHFSLFKPKAMLQLRDTPADAGKNGTGHSDGPKSGNLSRLPVILAERIKRKRDPH